MFKFLETISEAVSPTITKAGKSVEFLVAGVMSMTKYVKEVSENAVLAEEGLDPHNFSNKELVEASKKRALIDQYMLGNIIDDDDIEKPSTKKASK